MCSFLNSSKCWLMTKVVHVCWPSFFGHSWTTWPCFSQYKQVLHLCCCCFSYFTKGLNCISLICMRLFFVENFKGWPNGKMGAKFWWVKAPYYKKAKIVVTLYCLSKNPCLNFNHVIIKKKFQNIFVYYGKSKHNEVKCSINVIFKFHMMWC
jgi:hypothetical protein